MPTAEPAAIASRPKHAAKKAKAAGQAEKKGRTQSKDSKKPSDGGKKERPKPPGKKNGGAVAVPAVQPPMVAGSPPADPAADGKGQGKSGKHGKDAKTGDDPSQPGGGEWHDDRGHDDGGHYDQGDTGHNGGDHDSHGDPGNDKSAGKHGQ